MAQFFASDRSNDNDYHVYLHYYSTRICQYTGHITMFCRGHEEYEHCPIWRGCDVQPEHDVIVDNWLYNNYMACQLL